MASRKSRLQGVGSAVVVITKPRHGDYAHARIVLRTPGEYPSNVCEIEFQANALTARGYEDRMFSEANDAPDASFDFGPTAHGPFYGGHIESRDFRIEHGGAGLRLVAKVCDKLHETTRTYNLHLVHPRCEVALLIAALERLNVPVEIKRYLGNEEISAIWSLPESERHPAANLFRAIREPNCAECGAARVGTFGAFNHTEGCSGARRAMDA